MHQIIMKSNVVSPEDVFLTETEAMQVLQDAELYQESEEIQSGGDSSLEWWDTHSSPSGHTDSWIDVAKVVWSSLRASTQYLKAISFQGIAFGSMALAKKHERVQDGLEGSVRVSENTKLEWLDLIQWSLEMYDPPASKQLMAEKLGIEVENIISYQSQSMPLPYVCPAYLLAVDNSSKTIRIVIRGTSQLSDLVADVCGHCTPFFSGFAHHGMLRACKQIIAIELQRLQATCKAFPGYPVQCFGHSLGGGIASLICCTLHNSPGLLASLGHPSVTSTSFGAPPVMTLESALACADFVSSIVYCNDMIARTSVFNVRALAVELEECKEEVIAQNPTLSFINSSFSKNAVSAIFKMYAGQSIGALAGYMANSQSVKTALATGAEWLGNRIIANADNNKDSNSPLQQQHNMDGKGADQQYSTSTTRQLASNFGSALLLLSSKAMDWNNSQQTAAPVNNGQTATTSSVDNSGPLLKSDSGLSLTASSLFGGKWGSALALAAKVASSAAAAAAAADSNRSQNNITSVVQREIKEEVANSYWLGTTSSTPSILKPESSSVTTSAVSLFGGKWGPTLTASVNATKAAAAASTSTDTGPVVHTFPESCTTYSRNSSISDSSLRSNSIPAATVPSLFGGKWGSALAAAASMAISAAAKSSNISDTATPPSISNAPSANFKENPLCARPGPVPDAAVPSDSDCNETISDLEQHLPLYNAGELYYIDRDGMGDDAQFHVFQSSRREERFQKLLLKKSMLRDHYLVHYKDAIERTL